MERVIWSYNCSVAGETKSDANVGGECCLIPRQGMKIIEEKWLKKNVSGS